MKIKVLERSCDQVLPASRGSPAPKRSNLDPSLHPMSRPREYNRALAATKLSRIFAKPFIGDMEQSHADGIYSCARDSTALAHCATGAGDGEIRLWNLATRQCLLVIPRAHKSLISGLAYSHTYSKENVAPAGKKRKRDSDSDAEIVKQSGHFLSCSSDKTVKLWAAKASEGDARASPVQTYHGTHGFNAISHHASDNVFATASDKVQIWDETRSDPILSLSFDSLSSTSRIGSSSRETFSGEHLTDVAFNLSSTSLLASASADRSIVLYDLRTQSPTSKNVMSMRANSLCFNPLQPTVLLAGSEDQQAYTFDIRKLSSATQVYKGHVGPVMSVDWSPTGREFVSGSYDRTVRVWDMGKGKSKDIYHTKRMQRVFTTMFTLDSKFIISGSDDGNLRVWKAAASAPVGYQSTRQMARIQYRDALRSKWSHVGQVAKIERQRFLPKDIYSQTREKREMLGAIQRREDNKRAHAPKGLEAQKPKAERKKSILRAEQ